MVGWGGESKGVGLCGGVCVGGEWGRGYGSGEERSRVLWERGAVDRRKGVMEVGRRRVKEVMGLCMGRDCGRVGRNLVIGWLPVRLC